MRLTRRCVQYMDGLATFEEISYHTALQKRELDTLTKLYGDSVSLVYPTISCGMLTLPDRHIYTPVMARHQPTGTGPSSDGVLTIVEPIGRPCRPTVVLRVSLVSRDSLCVFAVNPKADLGPTDCGLDDCGVLETDRGGGISVLSVLVPFFLGCGAARSASVRDIRHSIDNSCTYRSDSRTCRTS